jgi:hypothetical protein
VSWLGVAPDLFDERIRNELKVIRQGRGVLYPIASLERWLEKPASTSIEEAA